MNVVMPTEATIHEDQVLLERITRSGDEAAFERLHAAHTPALLRFVERLLGADRMAAEDVVQDTWVRALTGLAGFRHESTFRTWLHAMALNVVREHWRRHRRRDHEEFTDVWPDRETTPDVAIDLEAALGHLPSGRRTVVLLHDLEGYSHEEIGEMLGIAAGTSKSQLHDARRQLRRLLIPEFP